MDLCVLRTWGRKQGLNIVRGVRKQWDKLSLCPVISPQLDLIVDNNENAWTRETFGCVLSVFLQQKVVDFVLFCFLSKNVADLLLVHLQCTMEIPSVWYLLLFLMFCILAGQDKAGGISCQNKMGTLFFWGGW